MRSTTRWRAAFRVKSFKVAVNRSWETKALAFIASGAYCKERERERERERVPDNSSCGDVLWTVTRKRQKSTLTILTYARRSQWSRGHQRPPAIALCSWLLLSFRTSCFSSASVSRLQLLRGTPILYLFISLATWRSFRSHTLSWCSNITSRANVLWVSEGESALQLPFGLHCITLTILALFTYLHLLVLAFWKRLLGDDILAIGQEKKNVFVNPQLWDKLSFNGYQHFLTLARASYYNTGIYWPHAYCIHESTVIACDRSDVNQDSRHGLWFQRNSGVPWVVF